MSNPGDARPPNHQFVTALARGLDVLRCFDRPRIELTVSEIARRIGLPQPTAWRLCATLAECGYLVRGASDRALRIGAPAMTLGYAAARGLGAGELVRPYLRRLSERTNGNAMLSVRAGLEVILVEHQLGEFMLPNQPVGWRAPLTAIPSGLAMLVGMTETDRRATLAALETRDTAWERHRRRIADATQHHARSGYVLLAGMLDGQYTAIATPLFDGADTGRQWALSVGGASSRWSEAHCAEASRELLEIAGLLRPALRAIGDADDGGDAAPDAP